MWYIYQNESSFLPLSLFIAHTEACPDGKQNKEELWVNCNGRWHSEKTRAGEKTETISPAPHSHEGHNSAESKTTHWNRKSVFLGIHLHSNYSDILGRARGAGLIQCTVAKKKNFLGQLSGLWHEKTKLLACKKKKMAGRNQIKQRMKKTTGPFFSWQRSNLSFVFCFFSFFLSLLPSVTRLSYRHEAKEWGRQSGNTRYHEEWDASPPWHGVHGARTPPRPPQASAHKHIHARTHTQYLDSICTVHMQTNPPNTSRWYECFLLSLHTRSLCFTHPPPLASVPPSLPPSPPSEARSACVPSYLLQPIIVPTYGVSSC